eukprot:542590_1
MSASIAALAIWTGLTIGICLCVMSYGAWLHCVQWRLSTIGQSTTATVTGKKKTTTTNIDHDPAQSIGTTTSTSYNINFSYSIVTTEQSLRYVLQRMAKASNVYLPDYIIDLCLLYVANSFHIYYAPIYCKHSMTKRKWGNMPGVGGQFYIRYDPKYPQYNNVSNPQYNSCCILCGCLIFVFMGVIAVLWWIPSVEKVLNNVSQMVWITSVAMIFVVLITVVSICIKMHMSDFKSELKCRKILDREDHERGKKKKETLVSQHRNVKIIPTNTNTNSRNDKVEIDDEEEQETHEKKKQKKDELEFKIAFDLLTEAVNVYFSDYGGNKEEDCVPKLQINKWRHLLMSKDIHHLVVNDVIDFAITENLFIKAKKHESDIDYSDENV